MGEEGLGVTEELQRACLSAPVLKASEFGRGRVEVGGNDDQPLKGLLADLLRHRRRRSSAIISVHGFARPLPARHHQGDLLDLLSRGIDGRARSPGRGERGGTQSLGEGRKTRRELTGGGSLHHLPFEEPEPFLHQACKSSEGTPLSLTLDCRPHLLPAIEPRLLLLRSLNRGQGNRCRQVSEGESCLLQPIEHFLIPLPPLHLGHRTAMGRRHLLHQQVLEEKCDDGAAEGHRQRSNHAGAQFFEVFPEGHHLEFALGCHRSHPSFTTIGEIRISHRR